MSTQTFTTVEFGTPEVIISEVDIYDPLPAEATAWVLCVYCGKGDEAINMFYDGDFMHHTCVTQEAEDISW